jgi:hypothetical protein
MFQYNEVMYLCNYLSIIYHPSIWGDRNTSYSDLIITYHIHVLKFTLRPINVYNYYVSIKMYFFNKEKFKKSRDTQKVH